MRCVICHRPLQAATATIQSRNGPLSFGPECARRAGLTHKAIRQRLQSVPRATKPDSAQIDLFAELEKARNAHD